VEYSDLMGGWLVLGGGRIVAVVCEEADARAFVALPALEDLLRAILADKSAYQWHTAIRAALAQADGPLKADDGS
jgi:hypothetical protein